MNNYCTIGRLTRDPDTTYTTTGKAVTSFDLAVDVGYGDRKKTIFWPCKFWGEKGVNFAKYVAKGHRVAIQASVDQEEWTDRNTQENRKKLVLDVRDFTLIERKDISERPSQERPPQSPAPRPSQQDDSSEEPNTDGLDGDDIPF